MGPTRALVDLRDPLARIRVLAAHPGGIAHGAAVVTVGGFFLFGAARRRSLVVGDRLLMPIKAPEIEEED